MVVARPRTAAAVSHADTLVMGRVQTAPSVMRKIPPSGIVGGAAGGGGNIGGDGEAGKHKHCWW